MAAKLYFYYSAMNAGKSAILLQSSYNYNERGMQTLLFIPKIIGKGKIMSRIGLQKEAIEFEPDFNFFELVKKQCNEGAPIACLLIDEAQFLAKAQVKQLARVCDRLGIPVLCYGLRTDFQGEPFEGSMYLLGLADVVTEIKTICDCGRKATMNQRVDAAGLAVAEGDQIEVGGNDEPFEGSMYLLGLADVITEIKAICDCGRKATMNQRVNAAGEAVAEGDQIEVGGNERYIGRCRKHWDEHFEAAAAKKRARTSDFVYDTPQKAPSLQRRPSAVDVASCERLMADTKMLGAD
eukprot:CAMPEP_0172928852 /NCGR_PEP_ID=MMETSP1075-20121228/218185_1 /TAXON_ID=2916 /ORGANISM="Ceratium fusus, Strain PA161109" /LENGTH=293 /DNA_ID=CAMNT_0013790139 /DNA_START=51 /DNA_END=932 /DNA_ORIENTATION=-